MLPDGNSSHDEGSAFRCILALPLQGPLPRLDQSPGVVAGGVSVLHRRSLRVLCVRSDDSGQHSGKLLGRGAALRFVREGGVCRRDGLLESHYCVSVAADNRQVVVFVPHFARATSLSGVRVVDVGVVCGANDSSSDGCVRNYGVYGRVHHHVYSSRCLLHPSLQTNAVVQKEALDSEGWTLAAPRCIWCVGGIDCSRNRCNSIADGDDKWRVVVINRIILCLLTNTIRQIKGEGRESADDLVRLHRDNLFGDTILGISVSLLQ